LEVPMQLCGVKCNWTMLTGPHAGYAL